MVPNPVTAATNVGATTNKDTTTASSSAVALQTTSILSEEEKKSAIDRFCEYLRFETVSTIAEQSGAYRACGEWLINQLNEIKCFTKVFKLEESPDDAPVIVAYWEGVDPTLPVLLLNSHYDVVPAAVEDWTIPPFDGAIRNDKIYGRGTQDMKCVGIQYMEAIRKIVSINPTWKPQRSIYLTYVPDEEVGGAGMACFLDSALYKSLPGISLALDEGLASTTATYDVFYGERLPWFIEVKAHGPTGHGSRFIENTAVEQLIDLCNKALAFRQGQRELLLGGPEKCDTHNCAHAVAAANAKKANADADKDNNQGKQRLGDVTSLNITSLQAGVKAGETFVYNCVPPQAKCSLDIRISPTREPVEILNMLNEWCKQCTVPKAVKAMEWNYIGQGHDSMKHALTSCDPKQNAWYNVFESTLEQMGYDIQPQVFPAATDSRFLRALGIRAFGFSPMRSTEQVPCEILLHENDECIPIPTFLEGVGVYVQLIQALGSQGEEMDA